MAEYRVEWSVEVEADSPEQAARLTLAIQRSSDRSLSGGFSVWCEDDPDHPTLVDLFPERPDTTGSRGTHQRRSLARDPDRPKIRMICPYCGSDDVTRDCLARWNVADQQWEVTSELDSMRCEACDREIGPAGFSEAPLDAETRDIGLAIASFLEGRTFAVHQENRDGGTLDPVADAEIQVIDVSDPNNLTVALDSGRPFIVRIIAGA